MLDRYGPLSYHNLTRTYPRDAVRIPFPPPKRHHILLSGPRLASPRVLGPTGAAILTNYTDLAVVSDSQHSLAILTASADVVVI